jgi:hypothetical protein
MQSLPSDIAVPLIGSVLENIHVNMAFVSLPSALE